MSKRDSRTLSAFMQVSLDGHYCDVNGEMAFAHKPPDDTEWNEFVEQNANRGDTLLFGRKTYDMMVGWWPTAMAAQAMPRIASGMNATSKVVFSRTLTSADWNNTTLVADDLVATVQRMKGEAGPDMAILGSGSIVTQLADAGLVDTLQVAVNPVALGAGMSLFSGLKRRLDLVLTNTRVFTNGTVVLWYAVR